MNQPNRPVKTILVPVAFSDNCALARDYAFDLARKLGAKVELLHIVEAQPYQTFLKSGQLRQEDVAASENTLASTHAEPEFLVRDLLEEARGELERMALPSDGVTWEAVVSSGHAASEILREIDRLHPDLVVMATHQRKGLVHAMLGSVTEKVLRAAPVPVLALPMKAAAA